MGRGATAHNSSSVDEMTELNHVSFPRGLFKVNATDQPSLCIFAATSQEAFGVCAYIRQRGMNDKYEVKLVAAKSKVVQLKQLTIPRLQLKATVLESCQVKTIYESRIELKDVKFFTDSAIVLARIHSTSGRFKPFVSSRVGEIQSNSNPRQWQHIPGQLNVADYITREICVVAATIAKTRRKFCILKGNKLIKSVKFKCGFCREMAHKTETKLMANLLPLRLAPYTPPFYITECDYFAPQL